MKKLIVCILLFAAVNSFAETPSIVLVRNLYKEAVTKKSSCVQLIDLLKSYSELNYPLLVGYKACGTMLMAKHVFNPFSKISYFKKGRIMLEKAIQSDNKIVELRFLRFTVQTNAPSFLGYNNQISNDKLFLQKALPLVKDAALKEMIISYFKKIA